MRTLLALLLCVLAVPAVARPLTAAEKACLFREPVVIGASISAETGRQVPGFDLLVNAIALHKGTPGGARFGLSPSKLLIANYAAKGFDFKYADYSEKLTQPDTHGSNQIIALLTGERRDVFQSASVILGIDAFYWDAISSNCGYDSHQGVEPWIRYLIEAASEQGVRLILGNVPHEDPSKVPLDGYGLGDSVLWQKPNSACTASINRTLEKHCRTDRGCYLVDVDQFVQKINRGEKLRGFNVEMSEVEYGLFDLRPDGVHLSPSGSAVIYQSMVDALESIPPSCPMNSGP